MCKNAFYVFVIYFGVMLVTKFANGTNFLLNIHLQTNYNFIKQLLTIFLQIANKNVFELYRIFRKYKSLPLKDFQLGKQLFV